MSATDESKASNRWRCNHCGNSINLQGQPEPKFCSECGKKQTIANAGGNLAQDVPALQTDTKEELTESEGKRAEDEYCFVENGAVPEIGVDKSRKSKKKSSTQHMLVRGDSSASITIIFHILIPRHVWGWTDQCSVHIRYRSSHEGWSKECGIFKLVRELHENLEFEGAVDFMQNDLRDGGDGGVHYLYYIQNSSIKNPCELLHGAPSRGSHHYYKDRYLRFPKDRGAPYHHYDSMAHPDDAALKKGPMKSVAKSGSADIPDRNLMNSDALLHYLEEYRHKICGLELSPDCNIEYTTQKIVQIYKNLSNPLVGSSEDEFRGTFRQTWPCEELHNDMMHFLVEIVDNLFQTDIKQNVHENGKRMASTLTVVCCFLHIATKLEDIPIIQLLSMLRLMPDTANQLCIDWDFVNEVLPQTMKKKTFEAVHKLVVSLSHKSHFSNPEWLYALPVVHFLDGSSEPYKSIEHTPRAIQWGDRVIGLGIVKDLISDKKIEGKLSETLWEKLYEDLKPLISLDPLLLYGFFFVCPKKELSKLLPRLVPYFSISFMASQLNKSKMITANEAEEYTRDIGTIMTNFIASNNISYELWKSTFDASIYLLQEMLQKLNGIAEVFFKLLTQVIKLVLQCSGMVEIFKSQKDIELEINHMMCPAFHEISKFVEKFITDHIGNPFGLRWKKNCWSQDKAESEIKVWNALLSIKLESEEVLIAWHNQVIINIMKSRVKKLDLPKHINLFVAVESVPNCHITIANTFMDAIMDNINVMSIGDVETLISSSSSQGKSVGKIIDKIMDEHYKGRPDEVTFEDLIDWSLWQTFIKIYNTEVRKKRHEASRFIKFISRKCIELFTCAKSVLDDVVAKVHESTLTVRELSLMKDKMDHVNKLLAANILEEEEAKSVQSKLEEKLVEYAFFLKRKEHLGLLCQQVDVPVKGLDDLRAEIKADHQGMPINKLCRLEGKSAKYLTMQSAFPLDKISEKFDWIFRDNSTDLFFSLWKARMKNARYTHKATLR